MVPKWDPQRDPKISKIQSEAHLKSNIFWNPKEIAIRTALGPKNVAQKLPKWGLESSKMSPRRSLHTRIAKIIALSCYMQAVPLLASVPPIVHKAFGGTLQKATACELVHASCTPVNCHVPALSCMCCSSRRFPFQLVQVWGTGGRGT